MSFFQANTILWANRVLADTFNIKVDGLTASSNSFRNDAYNFLLVDKNVLQLLFQIIIYASPQVYLKVKFKSYQKQKVIDWENF